MQLHVKKSSNTKLICVQENDAWPASLAQCVYLATARVAHVETRVYIESHVCTSEASFGDRNVATKTIFHTNHGEPINLRPRLRYPA